MTASFDNQTWLIETGDVIIQKKARVGIQNLSPWETLVYYLWVADYGMRNAGDLAIADDVRSGFHTDAMQIAAALSLPLTLEAFALTKIDLESEYFQRFDAMCNELRRCKLTSSNDGS